MPKKSLPDNLLQSVTGNLAEANAAFAGRYPGETGRRQPVQTVYGGAHLFRWDAAARLGELARRAFEEYAPNFATFARAIGLPGAERLPDSQDEISRLGERPRESRGAPDRDIAAARLASTIHARVAEKLRREPVEDLRIDFEDGYGRRPDSEEDTHAASVAAETAVGMQRQALPPFIGIRIKPLTEELKHRGIRTLDIFLSELAGRTDGKLPENFVVTLPKITIPEQVGALADLFELLERKIGLPGGSLRLEMMIETPQAIVSAGGEWNLHRLLAAARGRCVAAHFGAYDYTASCNITAAHQQMTHPACDLARHMMQLAFAGTGIWLSDGATNVLPIPRHKRSSEIPLSAQQQRENHAGVHEAWKLHFQNIQHSLQHGFYQGWDLHPAQLPARYAAVYSFFLQGLEAVAQRLKNFAQQAARPTRVGGVFDDAATGQGLLNYFRRAVACGALTEPEADSMTGLTLKELHSA